MNKRIRSLKMKPNNEQQSINSIATTFMSSDI